MLKNPSLLILVQKGALEGPPRACTRSSARVGIARHYSSSSPISGSRSWVRRPVLARNGSNAISLSTLNEISCFWSLWIREKKLYKTHVKSQRTIAYNSCSHSKDFHVGIRGFLQFSLSILNENSCS